MEGLLLSLGILIISLALIALFVKWYTALCYRMIVYDQSEVISVLLDTGEVPDRWRKRLLERFAHSTNKRIGQLVERFLIRYYARRINGVIAMVKGNKRANAQQKAEDVLVLKQLKAEWESQTSLANLIG